MATGCVGGDASGALIREKVLFARDTYTGSTWAQGDSESLLAWRRRHASFDSTSAFVAVPQGTLSPPKLRRSVNCVHSASAGDFVASLAGTYDFVRGVRKLYGDRGIYVVWVDLSSGVDRVEQRILEAWTYGWAGLRCIRRGLCPNLKLVPYFLDMELSPVITYEDPETWKKTAQN